MPERIEHPGQKVWSSAIRLRVALALFLNAGALGGCSLLFNLETAQCKSDGDCAAAGMQGRTCQSGQCVVPALVSDAGDAPIETEAGEATDADSGTEPDADFGCTATSCSDSGEPTTCSPTTKQCVRMRSVAAGCSFLGGASDQGLWRDPEALVVGAILGGGIDASQGQMQNLLLALEEFNDQALGLPGATSAAPRRRIVVVACDDSNVPLATSHLVESLGIEHVLWGLDTAQLRAFLTATSARAPFVVNLNGADSNLGVQFRGSNKLWHMLPSLATLPPVYAAAMSRMETKLRLSVSGDLRVVLFSSDNPQHADLRQLLLADPSVRVNGKPLGEAASQSAPWLLRVHVGQNAVPQPVAAWHAAASSILAFRPHLIVSTAQIEFVETMRELERTWPQDAGGASRPIYLSSPFSVHPELTAWINAPQGVHALDLRQRIVGLNFATPDSPLRSGYINGLTDRFGDAAAAAQADTHENVYDGVYFFGFALAAAIDSRARPSAEAVAQATPRITAADAGRAPVGPLYIVNGLQALAEDKTLWLDGVLGPLLFSGGEHTRPPLGFSAYCFTRPDGGLFLFPNGVPFVEGDAGGAFASPLHSDCMPNAAF